LLGASSAAQYGTGASISILCPLVQPNKAVGLESHIGSWLAGYLEPTLLCLRSFTSRRSSHHRIMKLSGQNRQWIWSRSRSARQASSCGKTSSGLDASRINSPHRGVGEIFLLTSPLIGQLTKGLNRNLPFGKLLCSLIKYLIFNNIPDLYRWSRIGRARFSQNSSYLLSP
jgi:hypothetical protein